MRLHLGIAIEVRRDRVEPGSSQQNDELTHVGLGDRDAGDHHLRLELIAERIARQELFVQDRRQPCVSTSERVSRVDHSGFLGDTVGIRSAETRREDPRSFSRDVACRR